MAGDFLQRTQYLLDDVGEGPLEGKVVVDQVYAQYQHEDLTLRHPGGGGPKYLEGPLFANHRDYLETLADNVLHGDLVRAMADSMESLSREVYASAPFEFGDLKASGHPTVTSQDTVVYDRPPLIHRLTDEEIDVKNNLRRLGLGNVPGVDGFDGS